MVRLNFNPVSPARPFRASTNQTHRPDRPPRQDLMLEDPFQDNSTEPTTVSSSILHSRHPPVASDTIASTSSASASLQRQRTNLSSKSAVSSASSQNHARKEPSRTTGTHGRSTSSMYGDHRENNDQNNKGSHKEGFQLRRLGDRGAGSTAQKSILASEPDEEELPWTLPLIFGEENPLRHLTQAHRDMALETLEIETMDRTQKLRASVSVLTSSLKFRTEAEIKRLPTEIRSMSVEEFWFKYNGSAKEYLNRQKENKIDPKALLSQSVPEAKRKRDTSGHDELWERTKRNKEEQDRALSRAGDQGSNRPSQPSSRYKPYPTPSSQAQTSSRNASGA
ncbi:hypothetical protein EMPS_01885 [Entomortierella parvispora]|uniref:Borealin N-terminal domain-containing protein n=1 Tax=Entomortierella parvispora TaxID=205924 RepID=A0A9P3H3Q1_9FUNG|nr:hypothetical protein EMPS_01885 [Entomortierella parvispora]